MPRNSKKEKRKHSVVEYNRFRLKKTKKEDQNC